MIREWFDESMRYVSPFVEATVLDNSRTVNVCVDVESHRIDGVWRDYS